MWKNGELGCRDNPHFLFSVLDWPVDSLIPACSQHPAQSILDLPVTEMVRAAGYRLTPSALHISPRHSVWKMLQSVLRIKAKSRKVKSFIRDRAGINTLGSSVSLLRLLP